MLCEMGALAIETVDLLMLTWALVARYHQRVPKYFNVRIRDGIYYHAVFRGIPYLSYNLKKKKKKKKNAIGAYQLFLR